MAAVILLIIIFWIPALFIIVRNIMWDLYNWQVKEYRVDRMKSHLLNQEEDFKQIFPIYVAKVVCFLLLIIYLFANSFNFLLIAIAVVFGIYLIESAINIDMLIGKRFVRPKISFRNILVMSLCLIMISLPLLTIVYPSARLYERTNQYFESNNGQDNPDNGSTNGNGSSGNNSSDDKNFLENFVYGFSELSPKIVDGVKIYPALTLALLFSTIFALATDLITPLFVSFFVIITEPISQIKRMRLIKAAKQKVMSLNNLKVIGITGSYGKTTTKEILFQILEKKFKTAKTDKNYNSAVGIAISILKNLKPDTEVFIAEMGAYTKNEVKKATDIVKPDISIVTGVDSQHLTLFGSQENIMKAKFEIIQNAKPDSIAILNGDNEYTLRMASMTQKDAVIYFTARDESKVITTSRGNSSEKGKFPQDLNLFAYDIERENKNVSFKIKMLKEEYKVIANLNTEHNVSNLLAAVSAALNLGISLKEIVDIINKTKFVLPYLNIMNGLNNTMLIDDGYNANSTGFMSALKDLGELKLKNKTNRKYIMTKGIMELGWEKDKVYSEIAQKIVEVSDGIITSDRKLIDKIKAVKSDFLIHRATDDIKSFIKGYNTFTQANDAVLIEGSMHGKVLNEIIDKN